MTSTDTLRSVRIPGGQTILVRGDYTRLDDLTLGADGVWYVPTLDLDARYSVAGYGGIAFYLLGYETETTPESWEYLGEPEGYDPDTYHEETGYYYPDENPSNYVYSEPEEIPNYGRVRAVMVGDDYVHSVDVDDLTVIGDLDYCAECGQIGCTHDGRDREDS
jgi:hypothetical protein